MNAMAEQIKTMLRSQVDDAASVSEMSSSGLGLSPFLEGSFDLYEACLLGDGIVFAVPTDDGTVDDGVLKRVEALQQKIERPTALFMHSCTPNLRKTLLGERRGFATATGDIYLPSLALSLSAREETVYELKGNFKPAEQTLFLYCLYSADGQITQSRARDELGMSSTGVSRALGQLVERNLLDYDTSGLTGRLKSYTVRDRSEFYRNGMVLFGNPISRRLLISCSTHGLRLPLSGLSALSALSDLTEPSCAVRAAGPREAKSVESTKGSGEVGESPFELQILRYDPRPLARKVWGEDSPVDPVTMMLTVGEQDERISIAVRNVMRRFPWYTE